MIERPRFDRRRFLTALGLGGAAMMLPSFGRLGGMTSAAKAADGVPARVVFFISPHGTVPKNFVMRRMGTSTDYSYPIGSLAESEFSPILQPLYRHRQKLLVLDNISRATTMAEYPRLSDGQDGNEHHLGQAHLMTCQWALQRSGATAIGGAASIDQVIGNAVAVPGRWASRVYGFAHQHPYNFIAANEQAPREDSPQGAFGDIMGLATPTPTDPPDTEPREPTRAERIAMSRRSVLDFAAAEFEHVLPRLGLEDRMKLERHRQLIRDLETSLASTGGVGPGGGAGGAVCDPQFTATGTSMQQFAKVTALTLACDLTRVVTISARPLQASDFNAPAGINIHQDIAHNSVEDAQNYTQTAEGHMTNFNRTYATQFAQLLDELDSIPEAGETMLDHTTVVWMTELGTGTHWLKEAPFVLAGGGNGYFSPGRYVHYASSHLTPHSWGGDFNVGPGHNRVYVSLMHSMGMTDRNSFGLSEVQDRRGGTFSLRDPLPMLTS